MYHQYQGAADTLVNIIPVSCQPTAPIISVVQAIRADRCSEGRVRQDETRLLYQAVEKCKTIVESGNICMRTRRFGASFLR